MCFFLLARCCLACAAFFTACDRTFCTAARGFCVFCLGGVAHNLSVLSTLTGGISRKRAGDGCVGTRGGGGCIVFRFFFCKIRFYDVRVIFFVFNVLSVSDECVAVGEREGENANKVQRLRRNVERKAKLLFHAACLFFAFCLWPCNDGNHCISLFAVVLQPQVVLCTVFPLKSAKKAEKTLGSVVKNVLCEGLAVFS